MNKATLKQIIILIGFCAALVFLLLMWIQRSQGPNSLLTNNGDTESNIEIEAPLTAEELDRVNYDNQVAIENTMNPKAVLTTNYGVVEIELYEDLMPITAGNFAKLAEEGFYNGTKFHRVIDGFMIQGGDPNSKGDDQSIYGMGNPGYSITDEHIVDPLLSNVRGTISMANSGPNSGGSQFFINTVDNVNLDFDKEPLMSKHPVFGRVVAGMDVVDTISGVATGPRDVPVEPVVVESVTIVREEG